MSVEVTGIIYRDTLHTVIVEKLNFEEEMKLLDKIVGVDDEGNMIPKIGSLKINLLKKACKKAIIEQNNVEVAFTSAFLNEISSEDRNKLFEKALELNPLDLGNVGF